MERRRVSDGKPEYETSLAKTHQDTTTSNDGPDEGVELFISADGQLQVSRSDTLDLEILGCVAGQLEELSSEVLENGACVHSGLCADADVVGTASLEMTVDTSDWELWSCTRDIVEPVSMATCMAMAMRRRLLRRRRSVVGPASPSMAAESIKRLPPSRPHEG